MKTLILKSDKDSFEKFFLNNMQNENVDTYSVYKQRKGILYFLSVIWMQHLHLPFEKVWYNSWKRHLINYECVIVFDRVLSWKILRYIHHYNPKCRIIFWYWNTIDNKKNKLIKTQYREYCEVWSFDKVDCKKYNLKYNIQFYFIQPKNTKTEYKYDAIFIGYDKGRFEIVKTMNKILKEKGYRTLIKIVRDETSVDKDDDLYCDNGIPYQNILKLIKESKSIIDVPQEGQAGITMRVLESLFHERKLITTDEKISKYDFYNGDNIFIWKEGSGVDLAALFSKAYIENKNSILQNNSFEKWLENFKVY